MQDPCATADMILDPGDARLGFQGCDGEGNAREGRSRFVADSAENPRVVETFRPPQGISMANARESTGDQRMSSASSPIGTG